MKYVSLNADTNRKSNASGVGVFGFITEVFRHTAARTHLSQPLVKMPAIAASIHIAFVLAGVCICID